MAAILRVKRRRNEDPVDTLVLECKRFKSSSDGGACRDVEEIQVKSSFKFAATVPETESTHVTKHVRDAIRKEKLQKEYKRHGQLPAITEKSRQAQQKAAKSSRYTVIGKKRALNLDDLDEEKEGSGNIKEEATKEEDVQATETSTETVDSLPDNQEPRFHLYDVVNQEDNQPVSPTSSETITCNGIPMVREAAQPTDSENYVYDLYYMNNADFDFRALENIVAIEAFNDDLRYDELRGGDEDEIYDDEDDSNDEGNWRNDYPEEDPRFFENQEIEYYYGDDGTAPGFGLDGDDWGLAERIKRELLMDDPEDFYHEDDVSTTEDELDNDDIDEESEQGSSRKWFPKTSYEAYKMKVIEGSDDGSNHGNT